MAWRRAERSIREALLLLGGAVVAAPLFKRLGLGSVLGYLAAGVAIGPAARLITGGEEILHVAELGIVFLLFIIGLELKPSRLWAMRRDIFGLGLAQVLRHRRDARRARSLLAGLAWPAAIIIGFGLAMSSTAFGMQILEQEGTTNTQLRPEGVLDPAVPGSRHRAAAGADAAAGAGARRASRPPAAAVREGVGAIAALLLAGRYLLNPLFRIIAHTGAGGDDRRGAARRARLRRR